MKMLSDEFNLRYKFFTGFKDTIWNLLDGTVNGNKVKVFDNDDYRQDPDFPRQYHEVTRSFFGKKYRTARYQPCTIIQIDKNKKAYRGFITGRYPVSKINEILNSMKTSGRKG